MHWLRREDLAQKTVSYAQNHEDILLARALPHRDGLYIDVGANHPVFHSVTKLFADRGWEGINIEPSPPVFDVLRRERPGQVNLNVGIGDRDATMTFYEAPTMHGWSTFRPELATHYRNIGVPVVERPVAVRMLTQICEEHVGDRTIDFLKIDAEGFEEHALIGMDFNRWRPRVVAVENACPELWEPKIVDRGYHLAAFDGLNRFYVRAEDAGLMEAFRAPVNVLDNFIPHEYVRLLEDVERQAASRASLIDSFRRDAPRVARKLRRVMGRLGRRAG